MSANCNLANLKNNPDRDVLKTSPSEVDAFKDIVNGAKQCVTAEAGYEASLGWGAGSVKGAISTSMGCEQVSAIIDILHNTRKQIACTLKNRSKSVKNTIMVGQTANIKIGTSNCKTFFAGNLSEATLVLTAKLSEEDTKVIKNTLQDSVDKILSTVQSSERAFAAPISGGKSYQQSITDIDDLFESGDIENSIEEIANDATVQQGVTIEIENLGGDLCRIGNESILNLTAQSMIDQTMNQVFELESVRGYLSTISTEQKSKSEGLFKATSWTTIVAVIIAIVVIAVIAYFGYRWYKRRQMEQQGFGLQGFGPPRFGNPYSRGGPYGNPYPPTPYAGYPYIQPQFTQPQFTQPQFTQPQPFPSYNQSQPFPSYNQQSNPLLSNPYVQSIQPLQPIRSVQTIQPIPSTQTIQPIQSFQPVQTVRPISAPNTQLQPQQPQQQPQQQQVQRVQAPITTTTTQQVSTRTVAQPVSLNQPTTQPLNQSITQPISRPVTQSVAQSAPITPSVTTTRPSGTASIPPSAVATPLAVARPLTRV